MAEVTPPKPLRLALEQFPKEPWAESLVDAFNQLALQTTQALTVVGPKYKTLDIKTGVTPANSFPIDVKVEAPPKSVRVAMVLAGTPSGAVSVTAQVLSGGKLVRVSNISGLAANTSYSIRLAME